MRTFASILLAYAIAASVLWSAFVCIVRAVRPLGVDRYLERPIAIVGVGLIGYLAFFVYVASPRLGLVCSVVTSVGFLAAAIWLRRSGADDVGGALPFALALLFGIVYLSGTYLYVPEKVPGLVNWLFFEAEKAGDNNNAMAFAHAVYKQVGATGTAGQWYFSDRPPLQTGFDLFFTPLRGIFGNDDAHQAVGTLLQVSIIAAIWLLGEALRLRSREILLSVLAIGGTGFVFYNSIYVWPKLLAATFFVVVLIPLGRAFLDRRRLTVDEVLVVAGAAALAMLSHGAVAFSLLALAVLLAVMATRFFDVRTFFLAAVTAVALYAPWAGYTRFVDPNINRLLKMHLTDGDNLSPEPFLTMLARSYRQITLERWAANRLENLRTMFGADAVDGAAFEILARKLDAERERRPVSSAHTFSLEAAKLSDDLRSFIAVVRVDQREHAFRSLGLLNIAWPILLLALFRRRCRERTLDRSLTALLVVNTLGAVAWIVLEFSPTMTVNTHASFALVVLMMLSAVLLLDRAAPRLAVWVCALNTALTVAVWILTLPGPALRLPPGINWVALLTGSMAAAAIAMLVRRECLSIGFGRTKPDRRDNAASTGQKEASA